MGSKIIPLSPKVHEQWFAMRQAINAAASPFTSGKGIAIAAAHYLYDIPQASREMDAALKLTKETNVMAGFDIRPDNKLVIELKW